MNRLLVISDEPALAQTLESELQELAVAQAGFEEAPRRLREEKYGLVVIDDHIGADRVAEGESANIIRLKRPVLLSELLYTIRERLQGKNAGRQEIALNEDLRFSPPERLIRGGSLNMPITLTEKETELLRCLVEAQGRTVSRDALLKHVWGYSDDIATHTLETHIYRLRGKLRQASEKLDVLSSEEGGYRLKG